MWARFLVKNLTFVVVVVATMILGPLAQIVWAAPHEDVPTTKKTVADPDAEVVAPPSRMENLSIGEAPPVRNKMDRAIERFSKKDYFYPYRKEIDFHAGVVFGIKDSSDDKDDMNYVVGFGYLLPSEVSPKWNLGADLSTVGHGHLNVERRHLYNEKGSFRPFYQYGVAHKWVPEEKFASFSNWDNYLLRAGVGFADIRRPPKSVQLELNVMVGAEDVLVTFTYGYAWGL